MQEPNPIYIPVPYPVDSFHLLVKNAYDEVKRNVQAPDALIATSFLAVMSVSCQGLVDVRLPTGQLRPVSLNLLVRAESGERKTAVDNIVADPIYKQDEEATYHYEADLVAHKANLAYWKAVDVGIRHKVTKCVRAGLPTDDLRLELEEHSGNAPVAPRLRRFMRNNITDPALMQVLEGDGESIALMSDEGEVILRGGAMTQMGLRNKGWDGARLLTFDRATVGSVVARNPRVTICVMVQSAVLDAYLEKHGDVARGSGHWARYLVASPASTQGSRFINIPEANWIHLKPFHARVNELLQAYKENRASKGEGRRVVVEFSDEAKAEWVPQANIIESMIQPQQYMHDVSDFASKAMEIAGRVAALLHYFTKQDGKISVDTFYRAMKIMSWHLNEFKRLFSSEGSVPKVIVDAAAIENYLYLRYWQSGHMYAARNDVLRCGPVRAKKDFDPALDTLIQRNRVSLGVDPKSKKRFLNLNGHYFSSVGHI